MRKEESVGSMVERSSRGKENSREAVSPSSVVPEATEDLHDTSFFGVDWLFRHFHDSSPLKASASQGSISSPHARDEPNVERTASLPELTGESKTEKEPHPIHSLRAPPRNPSSTPPKARSLAFRAQDEAIGNAWNAKGLQSATKENWDAAVQWWGRALKIRIDTLGHFHTDVANTHNNLGIAYGQLGRYDEAKASLEKALKIRSRAHGRNHDDVAATLHNMGNLHQTTQHYGAALRAFEEALAIHRRSVGDADPKVARAWNAIGHLHYSQKDYKKARDAYRKALDALSSAGINDDDLEFRTTKLDVEEAEQLIAPMAT